MSAWNEHPIIHLKAADTSIIFDLIDQQLAIVYWGKALTNAEGIEKNRDLLADGFNFSELDQPINSGFWRENSRGHLGIPALLGHHEGKNFSTNFTVSKINFTDNFLEVEARDEVASLKLGAKFTLDPSGILLIENEVTNNSDKTFTLEALSTWLPIPNRAHDVMSFSGRWVKERQMQRSSIDYGIFARESREGRSGHDATIVMLALTKDCGFQNGEVWSCGLAWSGNTRQLIEKLPTGQQSIGASELLLPGEIQLASNQTYQSPAVIFAYSSTGIDGISNQHYQWLRSRNSHPTKVKPRPLTLNVWEAVYFDHDLAKLTELADVAAEIGVERFVLDDGWFNLRRNDHAGLGDWWVDEQVWSNGLSELISIVSARGMEFGLWFEPEMVNPNSELYRSHPDWILQSGDRIPPEQRHQLVLNIAKPEVFDYLFDKMNKILSTYSIDYIKWDHNRVLIEPAMHDQAVVHEQTNSYYRLVDKLKSQHPHLEIESCASGGARIDLGAVMHVDRFWTSDCNEALERNYIQRWTGIAIPPELLGTHIGPPKSHTTGRVHNLAFRSITALFGHAGLEWDITETTNEERAHLKKWVDYYKANREFLHSGDVVRIEQHDGAVWVHGVVSKSKARAIFSVAQLAANKSSKPGIIKLAGLNPQFDYEVKLVEPAGPAETIQSSSPPWRSGKVISGELLINHGLRGEKLQPENAYLIELNRVN